MHKMIIIRLEDYHRINHYNLNLMAKAVHLYTIELYQDYR